MQAKTYGLLESRRVVFVKTGEISPNPNQPRRVFGDDGLRELAESIRLYGVLQPLTVRKTAFGKYELVAGERRLRASRMAGLAHVPCILIDADEKSSSLIALIENIQRCDLDFFEEADAIQRLIRQFGLSQEEAARRLGMSQPSVANKLRLLRHPPFVTELIRSGGLTARHARALLAIENEAERAKVTEHIIAQKLNVAQTEQYIEALAAASEKPQKGKIRTLYIFKDVRLFINTVTRAVDTMRRSGVMAVMDRSEDEDSVCFTIKVPKTMNNEQRTINS